MTNLVAATVVFLTNQVVNLHPSGEQRQVITSVLAVVSTPIVIEEKPVLLVSTNVLSVKTNVYVWREPTAPPKPPMPQLFQERKNQTNDLSSPRARP